MDSMASWYEMMYDMTVVWIYVFNSLDDGEMDVWNGTERKMVRWMCGMSLKDRKRSMDLYSLLGCTGRTERRWGGEAG